MVVGWEGGPLHYNNPTLLTDRRGQDKEGYKVGGSHGGGLGGWTLHYKNPALLTDRRGQDKEGYRVGG